jgi:hypothetical protein
MAAKIEFQNQADQRLQSKSRTPRSEDMRLRELEARLHDLSGRLRSFQADVEVVQLKSGPHIFDPALDLRVKVDAVRWMLRVAKHAEGPALEQILLTVANSLDQLEKTADPRSHAA